MFLPCGIHRAFNESQHQWRLDLFAELELEECIGYSLSSSELTNEVEAPGRVSYVFCFALSCAEFGDADVFEAGGEFGGVAFLKVVAEWFEWDVVFGPVGSDCDDAVIVFGSLGQGRG